jgi:hypothetical protein
MSLNESIIEDAPLTWFGELGYAVGRGPHLALSATLSQMLSGINGNWLWRHP